MELNERLKVYQYLCTCCHEYKCENCIYIEDEIGFGCLINPILMELMGESCDNFNSQQYASLAKEISLEEIKIALDDYQRWHCANTNCRDCNCFLPQYHNDCGLKRVRKKICEKLGKPLLPLNFQTKSGIIGL